MSSSKVNVVGIGRGLLASLLGGFLFQVLHVPLPWMLGPLFVVGVISIRGYNICDIKGARQFGQLLIGSALGQYFSPEVTRHIINHGWVILGAGAATIIFAWLGGQLLQRVSGIDGVTAFFACVPGGASKWLFWENERVPASIGWQSHIL